MTRDRYEIEFQGGAVRWQYWFTTHEERKRTGAWWNRRLVDLYAPPLER